MLCGLRRHGVGSRREPGGPRGSAGVRPCGAACVEQAPLAVPQRVVRGAHLHRAAAADRAAEGAHDCPGGKARDPPSRRRACDQRDRSRAGRRLAHGDGRGAPLGPRPARSGLFAHRRGDRFGSRRDLDVPTRPIPPKALGYHRGGRPTRHPARHSRWSQRCGGDPLDPGAHPAMARPGALGGHGPVGPLPQGIHRRVAQSDPGRGPVPCRQARRRSRRRRAPTRPERHDRRARHQGRPAVSDTAAAAHSRRADHRPRPHQAARPARRRGPPRRGPSTHGTPKRPCG